MGMLGKVVYAERVAVVEGLGSVSCTNEIDVERKVAVVKYMNHGACFGSSWTRSKKGYINYVHSFVSHCKLPAAPASNTVAKYTCDVMLLVTRW